MKIRAVGALQLALSLCLGAVACFAPALAQVKAQKIVGFGGSVTEIIVALGAEDRLVARDTTSNYPPSVLALPDVGYVRALSPEGVLSVGPDLVIAEGGAGPIEAVDVLKAAGVPYVAAPEGNDPASVLAKIDAVSASLGLKSEGAALKAKVEAGFTKAAAKATTVTTPKRVLFVLSLQGGRVMVGGDGSSADGIIKLAGGINAASGIQGYKQITDEAILTAAPDVILLMDREGDLAIGNSDVLGQPALAATPAAASESIVRMDGMLLLGFGPRTPEAAIALHDALYGAGN